MCLELSKSFKYAITLKPHGNTIKQVIVLSLISCEEMKFRKDQSVYISSMSCKLQSKSCNTYRISPLYYIVSTYDLKEIFFYTAGRNSLRERDSENLLHLGFSSPVLLLVVMPDLQIDSWV